MAMVRRLTLVVKVRLVIDENAIVVASDRLEQRAAAGTWGAENHQHLTLVNDTVKVAEDIIPLSSQRTGAVAADVTLTGSKLIYFDGTTSVADIVTSHDSGSAATLAGSPLLRSVDLRPVSIPGHP